MANQANWRLLADQWGPASTTGNTTLYPMRPLECVLPSGHALFVPSGWRHMVVNEQHSVGVAFEVGDVPMIEAFTAGSSTSGGQRQGTQGRRGAAAHGG